MAEARSEVFTVLLELAIVFSAEDNSRKTLMPSNKHGNIVELLKQRKDEAKAYIKCAAGNEDELQTANKLEALMSEVIKNCRNPDEVKYDSGAAAEVKTSEADAATIREWLKTKKFSFEAGIHQNFSISLSPAGSSNKRKLQRLKKEISILSNSLPDGIFVKVDEDRFDVMKVMIVGPEGSPYENGCFLFDLYLPPEFPDSCPKMNFLTTGGGAFYFNPNLYQDGKICLSLLGTWEGPGWDPETSSLLQLLVSLQGLVFVDHPLENEPGHEGNADSEESRAYNKGIRHATLLYAMTWYFTEPNPSQSHFNGEAKLYLYANKNKIVEQFKRWEASNQMSGDYCGYFEWKSQFPGSFEAMEKSLLDNLENFPIGVKME
jgi:ubiquitin-protein ligase